MTAALAPDRSIAATDRAIAGTLDDLLGVFAPDAVVDLDGTPVRGALRTFHGAFVAAHLDATHLWTTTVLPGGRQRALRAQEAAERARDETPQS